jgi:hypothetical protein
MGFYTRYGEYLRNRPRLTIFATVLSYFAFFIVLSILVTRYPQKSVVIAQGMMSVFFLWVVVTGWNILAYIASKGR